MKMTWGWLVIAVLLLAGTAEAQGHRDFGIGAFVGYSKADNAEDGSYHFGGDLTIRPLEIVGGRMEVGYRKDDLDVGDTEVVTDATSTYIPILFSLQVLPLGERLNPFSPFLFGGWGLYVTRHELDVLVDGDTKSFDEVEYETGWHLGTGLDFNLTEILTITGDLRWVFLDADPSAVFDQAFEDRSSDPFETAADGLWITGGVKFFFN